VYDGKCEGLGHMISIQQILMFDISLQIRMLYMVNVVCPVYDGHCEGFLCVLVQVRHNNPSRELRNNKRGRNRPNVKTRQGNITKSTLTCATTRKNDLC
jgi:hypothetical protein